VRPIAIVAEGAVTVTLWTGIGTTEMAVAPVIPSVDAPIVVLPGETPTTSPELLTVAMAGFDDVHAILRPASEVPVVLRTSTVATTRSPTRRVDGVMPTEMLPTRTVGGAVEMLPVSPPPPQATVDSKSAATTHWRGILNRLMS
jgi:hypothetical protein